MKTSVGFFHEKVEALTIVAKDSYASTCKGMLEKLGATIKKETPHEKEGIVVFVVKNLDTIDLHIFDNQDDSECYVHYYQLKHRHNDFLVTFYTQDSSRNKKFVTHIKVEQMYKKGEETRTNNIAEVFAQRDFDKYYPLGYSVSWPSWGSMSTPAAAMFAEGLKIAVQLAEDATKQFVK